MSHGQIGVSSPPRHLAGGDTGGSLALRVCPCAPKTLVAVALGLGLCAHSRERKGEAVGRLPTLIKAGGETDDVSGQKEMQLHTEAWLVPFWSPWLLLGVACLNGRLVFLKTKLPNHFPCREWQTPGLAVGPRQRVGGCEGPTELTALESLLGPPHGSSGLCLALPNVAKMPSWRISSAFFSLSKGGCMDILESPGVGWGGTIKHQALDPDETSGLLLALSCF